MSDFSSQIRQVYDQAAQVYGQDRQHLRTAKYVTKFLQLLKPRSTILDLGCGAGVPVDDLLLKKGHLVLGLDISPEQIRRARRFSPQAEYQVRDISTLKRNEYQMDGVVCLYTLFHLPRKIHGEWLKVIASYLPPGGPLLISCGEKNFEGWHDFYGFKMWSSQFAPPINRQLLAEAGFSIHLDEMDTSGRETHQIVLATKK